jgi:hypothetical protein
MELHYPSILDGVGVAASLITCQVCLSVAHSKGLCPFLPISGWHGPKPDFTRPQLLRFILFHIKSTFSHSYNELIFCRDYTPMIGIIACIS